MLTLTLVPVLFTLFYIVPGAVLISNSLAKEKRLENIAFAILLSLVFAPLTLTLLGRVVPGNDGLLITGYVSFWALAIIGIRFFPATVKAWLPDFSALPKADKAALLVSILLTVIIVSVRLPIFDGFASLIDDDSFNMAKLSSIAATGLPSLYSRQPLYQFIYFDLDYILPALWTRYTDGAMGMALAWVIHVGIQTFAISLFQTRLIYMFANTRLTRLFGLLAIHAATGLDLAFLPWLHELHLDIWPTDLGWFDGFMQISMPITLHLWVPQNMLGLAVVGLIYCHCVVSPKREFSRAIFVALLLVALFRTSTFVFIGVLPGLALWHLYELLTSKDRIRLLGHLAATALVAITIAFPFLSEALSKITFFKFGLRSFEFLDLPFLNLLAYPITASVYLFLELGVLFPLLLWLLLRPRHWARPLLFWIFVSVGLLFPFVVQTKFTNDIAMRGIMPAQFAAAIIGCYMLTKWEFLKKGYLVTLVTFQLVLSTMTVGAELFFRYTGELEPISETSRWIAKNTPTESLIFYEQGSGAQTHAGTLEENYGQRLAFVRRPHTIDFNFTPVPYSAWRCLPQVDLYDANSLCSIEAHIPGAQPVFVRYLSPSPSLEADSFTSVYESGSASIFSLSCPKHDDPDTTESPIWITGPFHQMRALLAEVPPDHSIAATSHQLFAWLQSEAYSQRLFGIVPEPDAALNALSQSGFLRTVMPEQEGAALASQIHLHSQLDAVDASSSPVWILLDYTSDAVWNDKIYSHVQDKYFVAQPNVARAQWLPCDQRVVLALPSGVDDLHAVQTEISFGEQLVVSEWRTTDRARRAGEFVPMELAWRQLQEGQFKFFVHLLDEDWAMHAQIDLPAAHEGTGEMQFTRMGLYLPPDLSAGQYQIRFGVYRPEDGQRLTLPNGEDSAHIPLTISP